MKCSLCGYEFEENEALATCEACILFKRCSIVCCPNCRYEMPKPKMFNIFKKKRNDEK